MKRTATDPGAGASPGQPAKLQKTGSSDQSGKGNDEKEKENGVHDDKSLLQNQNRALAADMRRRQRQESELEKHLAEAWAKQGHYDATLSAVKRAWDQVLADLNTAAEGLGLGPRPLHVKVEEDEDDDEEEGRLKVEIEDAQKIPSESGGESQSELSIMEKLLLPAAEVLSMDATDSSYVLKENSSDATSPSKKEESGKGNPRTYLGCMAGTSSALYDLDSDGYGLTSRENIKELVPSKLVDVEEVERGLQEKARFTAQLAGRLFQAMQAHLMSLPPAERKTSLDVAQLNLLAKKRKLEAERSFLSDQLTQARARCVELSESITKLREEYRRANRKLDKLAAEGVYIEVSSEYNGSGGGARGAGGMQQPLSGASGMMPPPAPITPFRGFASGFFRGVNNRGDTGELMAALHEAQGLAESRQKEADRLRLEKAEAEKEITRLKATTDLDTSKADLSGHPQFQRLGTQLAAEQDMLNLEKTRVAELEGQLNQMTAQVQQHEMALQQQMEQQRLRWKSEIVASNSMLNTAHEDLDKAQAKLRQEQRVGSNLLQSAYVQRDEMTRLLHQTEQQVSILKASLERATKAKEHAEAQAAKDRARVEKQGTGGSGSRDDENVKAKLADITRQLAGSKAIEDALQSELNTTLAAYAQSKEGNQKLVQEISRISHSQKELSDEVSSAKAQLKNRQQVRQTMELQIKTAAQMRDQGHALKQKALDLVAEAELKVQLERAHNLELTREVHTEKEHADRARQEVDALTQAKQALETAHSELKEHCDSLNAKYASMEEQLDRAKEQAATLTRKVEKVRSHNARLISLTEGANNKEAIDEEIREEELLELRKMIKCSVCQDRKKNRVITKCYHMFCDECVSQNLKTRNRKCPACAKPFGQDDVHELWLT